MYMKYKLRFCSAQAAFHLMVSSGLGAAWSKDCIAACDLFSQHNGMEATLGSLYHMGTIPCQ